MKLSLMKAGEDRLQECREVFLDSLIYERYFSGEGRLERSLRTAADRGELWLAVTEENEIAGVMRVEMAAFCGLYPYLALLGTKSSFRGHGVGRFLMNELERMAREAGSRRVTLMVSDFNKEAQAFYRSLGYWTLGLIPDAAKTGIGEYIMLKDL